MTGLAIADEAKGPAVMTDAQMDLVVAGDLTTPGNFVFSGFDNPAPGSFHPGLSKRNGAASGATGATGPWMAHFKSGGVIVCNDC